MEIPEQYLNKNVKCVSCGAEFKPQEKIDTPMERNEMKYALKRPDSIFWKSGWNQEEVISALRKGSISTDWLICRMGEGEKAIPLSEFLDNSDVFKRDLGEEKPAASVSKSYSVKKDDLMLIELQKSNEHLFVISWTLRIIAFVIGVILLFGVKLTFQ